MISSVITAMPTPFLHDKIDYSSLERLLDKQIRAKVSAVVLFGSTGEGANIEYNEYEECVKLVANSLKDTDVKLFVGASSTATSRVIKLAEIAKRNNAFGVLVSPSPYNKPTQDGIFDIYKTLSQTSIPFIAYNIPGRTCVDISDEIIVKISELPNFVGLKDSTGDIKRIIELKNKNSSLNLLCGDDYMFLANMIHGTNGIISVASNVIPRTMVKIYNLCEQNNYTEAVKVFNSIYPLFLSLFCQSNPIPIKFTLKHLGIFSSAELRSPLIELGDKKLISILLDNINNAQSIENSL